MTKLRHSNLLSVVDTLHAGSVGGSAAKLYRHRFVASLILGTLLIVSAIVLVGSYFLPLGEKGVGVVRIFFVLVGAGALISIYTLRALNQRVIATNIFIAFLGIALIYISFMTGGILSPASICLIVIPAIATLSIDSLAGKIWSVLAVVVTALFYFSPDLGVDIPRSMPDIDDRLTFLTCLVVTHAFIAFVTLYYDSISKKLRKKLILDRHDYRYLANYDTQTGVINRRHFVEILKSEIDINARNGGRFCLFFIDLNDFKKANDEFGHHFGDEILAAFASRITQRIRATDTLARIGGDEFCIIARDMMNEEEAKLGVERFEMIIQEPLKLKEANYTLKASIGWAIYPTHATDYEALLKYADQHMYEAKRRQKSEFNKNLLDTT